MKNIVPFSHLGTGGIGTLPVRPAGRGRSIRFGILGLVFFLSAPFAAAEGPSLDRLVAEAQEVYEETADLQARFVQEVAFKAMGRTEREEGTVFFKKPRMMRWDYTRPRDKKLIINAQTAWLYVPEDRLVYVQKAEQMYRSQMAVRFLSGIGHLAGDFHVAFAPDQPKGEAFLLVLTAKEGGTGIDRLYLTLDRKTLQVTRCRFDDAFGNRTTLHFSAIQTNTGLKEDFFRFEIPAGTETVTLP